MILNFFKLMPQSKINIIADDYDIEIFLKLCQVNVIVSDHDINLKKMSNIVDLLL